MAHHESGREGRKSSLGPDELSAEEPCLFPGHMEVVRRVHREGQAMGVLGGGGGGGL